MIDKTPISIRKLVIPGARKRTPQGGMPHVLDCYDWEQAFEFATFPRENVAQVIAASDGENDAESWIGLFLLLDGTYGALDAWCDYTGWD